METSRVPANRVVAREGRCKPEFFDFLRLPKEIRLMVYERLPIITTHVKCYRGAPFTVVVKRVPTEILATCRLVNQEAVSFLAEKAARMTAQPPRIIMDLSSIYTREDDWLGDGENCFPEAFLTSELPNWFDLACYRVDYQGLRRKLEFPPHRAVEVGIIDEGSVSRKMAEYCLEDLIQALWKVAAACRVDYVLHAVSHLMLDASPRQDHELASVYGTIRSNLAYTVRMIGPTNYQGMDSDTILWSQGEPIATPEWEEKWHPGEQY